MNKKKSNKDYIYFESIDELEEAVSEEIIFDEFSNLYGYKDKTNKLPAIFKITKQDSTTYVTHMPVNRIYLLTGTKKKRYRKWLKKAISWEQFKKKNI